MNKIRLFEMFSGYGGASFALKKVGIPFDCVGYSEIDKYAVQCYEQNHCDFYGDCFNAEEMHPKNFGDCTKINPNNIPDFDLLTGGFPCQSFSVAGKGLGELDTRGTLFNEIIRIAEVKKPKFMLLENVKGLTNKNHKGTFDKILSELRRIGYIVAWKVLNSKEHGIPQNRERVFFVCFREDIIDEHEDFNFPKKEELKIFLKDILESEVDEKYFLSDKAIEKLMIRGNNYPKENIMNCITAGNNYKLGKQANIIKVNNAIMVGNLSRYTMKYPRNPYNKDEKVSWCVSTKADNGVSTDGFRIRKLTPKECFRLMGFLNDEINLEGLSNTQRYKLAGNGWEISLVSKIFKEMFK